MFDTDQGSRLFVVGRDRDEGLAALLRDRSRRKDTQNSGTGRDELAVHLIHLSESEW